MTLLAGHPTCITTWEKSGGAFTQCNTANPVLSHLAPEERSGILAQKSGSERIVRKEVKWLHVNKGGKAPKQSWGMFMRSKRPVKGNEKIAPIESNELGTRVKYHVDTQPINPRNSMDQR